MKTNRYLEDEKLSIFLFLLAWIMYMLVYMTKNCYSAAMAAIVNEGVLTKSQTGAITAAFYLTYSAFQVVGGKAADRFSPGMLIMIGLVGAGIANLIIYVNQNYMVMIITWMLNGVVQFGIWPSVFKIISSQTAKEHRMKAVFYIGLASSAGLGLSYICAAFVTKWQYNFLISAVMLFVTALVWFFSYRALSARMVTEELEVVRKREKTKMRFRDLYLKNGVLLFLIASVVAVMLNLGVKSLMPVMIMESYENISPSLANVLNIILIATGILGMFAVRLLFPRRIRSEGNVNILLFAVSLPLLLIGCAIGKVSSVVIILVMSVIVALMTAATQVCNSYIPMRFTPDGLNGTVAGVANAVASLGIVFSNYGFALLAELRGWSFTVFCWVLLVAFSAIFCLVAAPLWKRFLSGRGQI